MNVPTLTLLDRMLVEMGADSTMLGNASIGLIKAPFTPSATLTIADITEANFTGYSRHSIGTPSVPFTSADGNRVVEGITAFFTASDTVTPNTIYGLFMTPGNSTTAIINSDKLANPVALPGPGFALTITPRWGPNPGANFGLNVISN